MGKQNFIDSVRKWETITQKLESLNEADLTDDWFISNVLGKCGFCEEFFSYEEKEDGGCGRCPLYAAMACRNDYQASGVILERMYYAVLAKDKELAIALSKKMVNEIKKHEDKFKK